MEILSFDNKKNKISRDSDQNNLFDLFQKNIVLDRTIPLKIYIVPREHEMRLDKISNHIYGSPNYVEELMLLNDITNPFSVKEGQYIYFCESSNLESMYVKDDISKEITNSKSSLINSSQSNSEKKNNTANQNLPVTIKSSNLKQVNVTSDNKVQIINSFE